MKEEEGNIFSVFDELLQRTDKETLLKQQAKVIWMTGLSGSGKTCLAKGLEKELHARGMLTQILDGDNVRTGINNNLGFSEEERTENIRRIAEISKLFLNCGIITMCCFVSPTIAIRQMAKEIIGPDDFLEIFVNASLEVCEDRDPKGLYKKARAGEIKDFTGIDAPFEEPENADYTVESGNQTKEESVQGVLNFILPMIQPQA